MVAELVIIPAWRRPEFLHATLQRLLIADDGQQKYWISIDRGFAREVVPVADQFAQQLGHRAVVRRCRPHRYKGNSYNVLMAYREAVALAPDFVHLVEEDVFVGADYFDFHRRAHELLPNTFSVSACRNQQYPPGVDPPPAPEAVYEHVSYQSIGVSFRINRLAEVTARAKHSYFTNPVAYCRRNWPNTAINPNNAEQDGLIHRVIEAAQASTTYPATPRAYHAGFVGYHRKGEQLAGTVEQKAFRLLAMTTEELNTAAHSYPDHVAVDLDAERKPVSRVIKWP